MIVMGNYYKICSIFLSDQFQHVHIKLPLDIAISVDSNEKISNIPELLYLATSYQLRQMMQCLTAHAKVLVSICDKCIG